MSFPRPASSERRPALGLFAGLPGVKVRREMPDEAPPYWMLISVLFSSVPLQPKLAMALYHVAYELQRTATGEGEVSSELAHGRVVNLRKDVLLGTIGGPSFEAELETERGKAQVRFLLTRQGLKMRQEQEPVTPGAWAAPRPALLN